MDEPLGRQPLPVTVVIVAQDERDARFWCEKLRKSSEYAGDLGHSLCTQGMVQSFKIYPRANND